jgi:hypothetical protein
MMMLMLIHVGLKAIEGCKEHDVEKLAIFLFEKGIRCEDSYTQRLASAGRTNTFEARFAIGWRCR